MIKLYFLIILSFFFASSTHAQTWFSGPAGNWCSQRDGKGQCVDTPKEQDDIIVDREASIQGAFNSKGIVVIEDGGMLTITNSQSGEMKVQHELEVQKGGILNVQKDLFFQSKSNVNIGSGGTVLVSGEFKNENNSQNVVIDGKLEIGGNFENGKNAVITGSGIIAIAGGCTNNGTIYGVSNTCAGIKNLTLPVELLFFDAKVTGDAIQLTWATSYEENFDHFVVERSVDAKEFSPVGDIIKGAGNSTNVSNYSFIDNAPLIGRSYYRLKAVDFDGTVEYHPATTVNFAGNNDVKVYPNPTRGNSIHVSAGSELSKNSSLKIYNIIGEEVYRSRFVPGNNEYNFEKPLEKGLYILIVEDGNNKKQMKLTVQ